MSFSALQRPVLDRAIGWLRASWIQLLLAAGVVLLFGLFWWRYWVAYDQNLVNQKKSGLQNQIEGIGIHLTSQINRRQAILTGMAASVKSHSIEELRGLHFDSFAAGLHQSDSIIRAIQYFPPQGSLLMYPIEGNEAVMRLTLDELMNDNRPSVRVDVRRAIQTRQITLSDPYELRQGGLGVVARQAVYREEEFLGVVTVVLNLEPLLSIPGLSPPIENVEFAIRDRTGRVFYGEEDVFASGDAVRSTVVLPEGSWTIGARPLPAWFADLRPQRRFFVLTGSFMAWMAGVITFLVLSNQAALKRTVQERTQALAKSEARYAVALQATHEGVWEWEVPMGIVYSSESYYSMLGYENRAFQTYEEWLSLVHPDDVERITTGLQQALQSGREVALEIRMRQQRGGWLYTLVRGLVVAWDPDGTARRMVGTVSDITQRKQAEDQLRASEARFRALFQNNHAIMFLIAPENGAVLDANPAACDFYGWSHAELTAKKISDINTLPQEKIQEEIRRAVLEQRNYFLFQHRLANNEIRDVEVYSGPIEQDGRTLLYSIVHDLTARRQAERALEASETRYRQLLQVAPVGIAVHSQGRIVFANPAGARLLAAQSPDQIIGRRVEDFVDPASLPGAQERLQKILAGEIGVYPAEERFRRLDGTIIQVELIATPIHYLDQPAIQMIVSDITQRKQAEEKIRGAQKELQRLLAEADESRKVLLSVVEDQKTAEEKLNQLNAELEQRVQARTAQLQAANQELEAFSYSVSHDLRSPLRGIDGWSQALLEDYYEHLDEKGRKYLERVRSETQRMGQLIDDLLRLSHISRQEINPGPVDLSALAERIAARLEVEYARSYHFVIEPGMTTHGDYQLLDILLTNLLSNACKFTGRQPQPVITFGRTCVEGKLAFFVRDNGAGFDMSLARNLFGAFQRMHRQSEFPGTGIGLATVSRIVHRHGGQVWADAARDQGATFYFTLEDGV